MNAAAEAEVVQHKPWQLLWEPLPDEADEYQREAIAEAQAARPDDEPAEDLG